jgi:hypothetical protein
MTAHTEIIRQLVESIEQAISSQDWLVDGANDPDSILKQAEELLESHGYRRDSLTGIEFIGDL